MTIRYGLIGGGTMGQEHIRNINLLDGAEVSAIADPHEGMRAQAAETAGGGARVFADYKELLSGNACDVFLIAAPNDTHYEILKDVLRAGKPILCEKPLCTTTADCRDILKLAENAAVPVWVAMEYRYMPPVRRLLEEVAAGTAGPLKMLSIREHRYPFLSKVEAWNRFERRTGGTMVEKCCHFWDLMRLILKSEPVRVFASGGMDVNHLDEVYDGEAASMIDNAFVIVDFASGARGLLDLCMFGDGGKWQEIVIATGPKGKLEALVPRPVRFARDGMVRQAHFMASHRESQHIHDEIVEADEEILLAGDHHGSTYFQHQRFLEMVRSGSREPEVTLTDGLIAVQVGEAAERSARTGEPVQLGEIL